MYIACLEIVLKNLIKPHYLELITELLGDRGSCVTQRIRSTSSPSRINFLNNKSQVFLWSLLVKEVDYEPDPQMKHNWVSV